ncbi:MAG TPA: hypothetical protein VFI47_07085 [Acidimicrobiales bacterium]|nr:hypothetical protein [Acidimicrobiales bacterium]
MKFGKRLPEYLHLPQRSVIGERKHEAVQLVNHAGGRKPRRDIAHVRPDAGRLIDAAGVSENLSQGDLLPSQVVASPIMRQPSRCFSEGSGGGEELRIRCVARRSKQERSDLGVQVSGDRAVQHTAAEAAISGAEGV